MFGEWGVNLFMMLTGYFMVNKTFRVKRFINILLEVQFYTILTAALAYALGFFSLKGIKAWFLFFFPVIMGRYWYVTAYVLVYLLVPYLNIFLNAMSREQWKNFLLAAMLVWCVVPTIFGAFRDNSEGLLYYTRFFWYILLYCLGAYCHRFGISFFRKRSRCIATLGITFAVIIASILIIRWHPIFFGKVGIKEPAYFWHPNTIPLLVITVACFCWFQNLPVRVNWVINKFASTTMAVYMIHDGILQGWLWRSVFKTTSHQNSPFLIAHILGAAVLIFMAGSLVDFIRQVLERALWRGIDSVRRLD